MATVELRHVSKRFLTVGALQEMELTIQDQEFLVLVGPSGSGKTTALRIVAGLEPPTSGDIYINGRRVTHLPPRDRDIAMVFQSYALYPHMNVAENLGFGLRLAGVPIGEIRQRVLDTARILELDRLLARKPRQLSGGQRQRVALGRAIVRRPQLFLMDEPLSNLDAQLRVQMRVELLQLHRQIESTILYVTHDQTEAMTLGDRIVVLKDGVVQQVAGPRQLYEEPANLFVARFIGSPPMNLLRLQLTEDAGGPALAGQGVRIPLSRPLAERSGLSRGQSVVLGIRPEHVRDETAADRLGLDTLGGTVEVVEDLGSELLVYVRVGEQLLTARFGGTYPAQPQQRLNVAVDLRRAHFFDPQSGHALGRQAEAAGPLDVSLVTK